MKLILIFFHLVFSKQNGLGMEYLQTDFKDFLNNKLYNSQEEYTYKEVYINNNSYLIFPVINNENVPTNGVIFNIPPWIKKYKKLEKLTFNGLYIHEIPNELIELENLKYLKLALPRDINLENFLKKIKKIEPLNYLDISSSVINESQYNQIIKTLKNVKIIDNMRLTE